MVTTESIAEMTKEMITEVTQRSDDRSNNRVTTEMIKEVTTGVAHRSDSESNKQKE